MSNTYIYIYIYSNNNSVNVKIHKKMYKVTIIILQKISVTSIYQSPPQVIIT